MMDLKSSVFWDITPRNLPIVNRHVGGTCHLVMNENEHTPMSEIGIELETLKSKLLSANFNGTYDG
jgi:hypothetical protein